MTWEDCDLYRIAENAIDSLMTTAEAENVKLDLSGGHAMVYGVPQQLYSIVYNLCDNAIKYHTANGKVWIRVNQDASGVTLQVQDNGIGIPEDCQDRIFERFYRVDKSRSKAAGGTGQDGASEEVFSGAAGAGAASASGAAGAFSGAGGTGLGLSIVKHAVLIHKAYIQVRSKPGIGSEFTVFFPNRKEK